MASLGPVPRMNYASTRGDAPVLEFTDVLLEGLALDGGLYIAERWPTITSGDLRDFATLSYAEVAFRVLRPFVGGTIPDDDFEGMLHEAYGTFRHDEVVPLSALGESEHLVELFWGPTLSFKDVALSLIGNLFEYELTRRDDRVTIVGATSGDTGSAAIEACRDRDGIQLVMLHPRGRVSDVQRLQMTTVESSNIHNVAVDGTFDDCQDLVKAMFADRSFRERNRLSAVNSINWARVAAQTVYYVTSAVRLGAPDRAVSFSVPTGNFGNVMAGHIARTMGVPIDQLVIASNTNDILTRTHETGVMTMDEVAPTISPAMDIQVSSNFERLLFELQGKNGLALGQDMVDFRASGALSLEPGVIDALRSQFDAGRATETDVTETMCSIHDDFGMLIDPHTAVGVSVGRRLRRDKSIPMGFLSTAHPAKFGEAVVGATGVEPQLPAFLADLESRPERCASLPNDLAAIEAHVEAVTA
ncbi:MAG: threonine synthase [Acidimicrobiales bacterium]|jgi:threonine synthase